jgi:hypothetical protein
VYPLSSVSIAWSNVSPMGPVGASIVSSSKCVTVYL